MHHIPQPVLRISQLHLIAQIFPIQVRVSAHHPGKRLNNPGVQIFLNDGIEHNARWILRFP
jgi:hypothetical protein